MLKLKIIIYYVLIARLPHSRLSSFLSGIRVWYVCNILKIMGIHKDNYFENGVYLGKGDKVKIGRHCHINENVFIQAASIGDKVMIAPNVAILSKSHFYGDTTIPMIEQGESEERPPIIEDNVWIGRNAIIMPGVRVGSGSVVGAGAVVVKDVESNQVVGGVPARCLKER